MISTTPTALMRPGLRFVFGMVVALLLNPISAVDAQGLVQGVQQGAQQGNKAAGPVGGVLGGAIGGVVGVFTGVLGVGNNGQTPPANGTQQQPAQPGTAKAAKAGKGGKATKPPAMLTQQGEPQLFWGDESPPDPNIIVDGPSKSTDAPH